MGQRHPNRMHPSTLRVDAQQNPILLRLLHRRATKLDLVARRRTRPKIHVHVEIACELQKFSLINTLCKFIERKCVAQIRYPGPTPRGSGWKTSN